MANAAGGWRQVGTDSWMAPANTPWASQGWDSCHCPGEGGGDSWLPGERASSVDVVGDTQPLTLKTCVLYKEIIRPLLSHGNM